MNLTKNQIYIISAVVIAVIVYFMFFRKKKATTVIVAPPAKSESGYFGEQWNWGTGPQEVNKADAMASMSGPAGNSVAGLMESNYVAKANAWPKTMESNFNAATPEMRKVGSATNFLGY